jgi:hypothetical protein
VSDLSQIFLRPTGQGWLALAGGIPILGEPFPALAEHLLQHIDVSLPPVCVPGREASGSELKDIERLLLDLATLLSITPVPITIPEIPDLLQALPGLVVLAGGRSECWAADLQQPQLAAPLLDTLQAGGVILACGGACTAMGSQMLSSGVEAGCGWLPGGILVTPGSAETSEQEVKRALTGRDRAYLLELAGQSVFALGPAGEVEIWSEPNPKLLLSRGWTV